MTQQRSTSNRLDTFHPDIKVSSENLHDTRDVQHQVVNEGQSGWVLQGVISRASFRVPPRNGIVLYYDVFTHQQTVCQEAWYREKVSVSLGPWCFLLRPATSHPSQLARARIFLRLHGLSRRMQLCGSCLVDHGRLDPFTASFTFPRVSLPAGKTRGYASCESSVSPQHALPRAAGGLLVLQRRSHPLRALLVGGIVSRARLLWSSTSRALI